MSYADLLPSDFCDGEPWEIVRVLKPGGPPLVGRYHIEVRVHPRDLIDPTFVAATYVEIPKRGWCLRRRASNEREEVLSSGLMPGAMMTPVEDPRGRD